ncbi:MAG TPA: hypothetical protein VH539_09910 [Gemmatimonadaceae bacterium]|jgi:hypothetical protein
MKMIQARAQYTALPSMLGALLLGVGLTALASRKQHIGSNGELSGRVIVAGRPVVGAAVSLYVATTGKPTLLAHGSTSGDGGFTMSVDGPTDAKGILYVVATGGRATADGDRDPNGGLTLLSVLGATAPKQITVNELTTVASAFTNAQFIHGDAIEGNALSLRIAAGNVPNFVDLETGTWGPVLLDPINSTQTTTLATLNTLASLISAYTTTHNDSWRDRFLDAATSNGAKPASTLDAMANIARAPWVNAKTLYALFDQAYPQPKDGARRSAPFAPYLAFAPPDFALMLCFAGGGMYANGRLMFDADGNLWSGQNWMPGSQSGVLRSIGGGTIKLAPNGKPLSPPVTGFTGMGVDGIGWGTGVTRDKVWVTSFNGRIGVMDFDGRPLGTETDFPFKEKLFGLQGVGISATGDVWIADGSGNQLLHFPGGRVKEGQVVKVAGLKSPFDIVIDDQNRVWVSNSQSETVVRFPADDPSKVETFRVGIGVRALALDSKGNVWVASNMSPDFPPPRIPDGASIMKQFQLAAEQMLKVLGSSKKTTGVIHMIRPDGTQLSAKGFDGGGAISVPWGLNIDGNDNVWIGNFWGRSVALMAGASPNESRAKPGEVLHLFSGGSIQMLTDVAVDPAGNVWAANNWNVPAAAIDTNPAWPTSTWGGGSGVTIIYGVAAPVKAPRMGKVQRY